MPDVRTVFRSCCCPIFSEILQPRIVALSIAAIGAAQVGAGLLGFGLPCTFHALLGVPCPGCGLTRSIMALLHGRLGESFWLHPLGLPLAAGLGAALLAAVLPGPARARMIRWISGLERHTGLCIWAGVLLMVIWAVRLTGLLPLARV